MTQRIMPTGECFCGCGAATAIGSYFVQGHDRKTEAWLTEMRYSNSVGRLVALGYGPGGENLYRAYKEWKSGQ